MPGGFHPFHAGHAALYQSAVKAFPDAEVYVAASNDTKTRPFPFSIKEKLAKLAGVAPGHFIQVKSPFQAQEITSKYNPNEDVLIFVRSEKDRNESPKPGGTKKDGSPSYYQPWTGKDLQPFSKHAYMAYLPTIEFGPGITSATEIRNAWPKLDDRRKTAMVMSLYPATQKNPKLAANVVKMLDMGMGGQEGVAEQGYGNHPSQRVDPRTGKKYVPPKSPLRQGVAEGAPIVVAQAPIHIRNPKKAPQSYRNQGDIVPPTKPPSTEKRGVKGRPGQRPMPNVSEGSDDPWGPQGNFAGDRPVNIGSVTVNKLQVGDIVTYFGQKARIEAMSKTGNTSRITIANKMGGITQDVLTRDLKRTGMAEEIGRVGGGFGTNYPGTYEEENGPFTHKGGLRTTSLTTESVDYLDEK